MSQELYKLPEGWEWKKLGELITLLQNGINGSQNDDGKGVPVSRIETIQNNDIDPKRIKYIEAKESDVEKYKYNKGDLIFSHINSFEIVGKVAIFNGQVNNLIHGVNLLRLVVVDEIAPKYLYRYIESNVFRFFLEPNIKKAINQASVNQKNLKNIFVPVTSKEEQTRIVKKLDALLSRIDQATAALKHSLELTDALFASSLNQAFNPLGAPLQTDGTYQLPDGWEWRELKQLCTFENGDRGKNYPSRAHFVDEGIPVINAGALNGWNIVEKELNFITKERFDLIGSGKIKLGDLLFCLRGSIGKSALNNKLTHGAIASSLVIVRVMEALDSNYLLFYFNSPLSRFFINHYNNGAAQPNLSARSLMSFKIPVFRLEEQQQITQKLTTLQTKTQASKAALNAKLTQLEQLKASLLDAAFRGEL